MANQEHLVLLKQEVGDWNEWRKEHRDIRPDLRSANLTGADLRSANLNGADLRCQDLSKQDLSRANLRGASLNSQDSATKN